MKGLNCCWKTILCWSSLMYLLMGFKIVSRGSNTSLLYTRIRLIEVQIPYRHIFRYFLTRDLVENAFRISHLSIYDWILRGLFSSKALNQGQIRVAQTKSPKIIQRHNELHLSLFIRNCWRRAEPSNLWRIVTSRVNSFVPPDPESVGSY